MVPKQFPRKWALLHPLQGGPETLVRRSAARAAEPSVAGTILVGAGEGTNQEGRRQTWQFMPGCLRPAYRRRSPAGFSHAARGEASTVSVTSLPRPL